MSDRAAQAVLVTLLAAFGLAFVCRGATNMDEMTTVHDGLRVLRGEVIYRDFFQLLPPGTSWLCAAAQAEPSGEASAGSSASAPAPSGGATPTP